MSSYECDGTITAYMPGEHGARRRSFAAGRFTVIVEPHEDDEAQESFTRQLAECCGVLPFERTRLLGPGYVRVDSTGQMWLLNNRERGLGHSARSIRDWADLFTRYAVRPGDHGTDAHGEWWQVVPEPEASK